MKHKNYFFTAAMALTVGTASLFGGSYCVMADGNFMEEAVMNLENVNSIKGSVNIVSEMASEEISLSTGISAEVEEMCEPALYHMTGDLEMDLFGFVVSMESYGEWKDDTWTLYYSDVEGLWNKNTASADENYCMRDLMHLDSFMDAVLQDETEEYNGEEVYVLTASYPGAELNKDIQTVCSMLSDGLNLGMDFANTTLDVEVKLYKDSLLPASLRMTVPEENLSSVVHEEEADLTQFCYEIQIQEYNTIESMEIPEDVLTAPSMSEAGDELAYVQNDDGNYVLTDYEEKENVIIAPIEGYEISENSGKEYLIFHAGTIDDSDGWNEISFYLTEITEDYNEEILKETFASQTEYMTEENDYYDVQYKEFESIMAGDMEACYASYTYSDGGTMWYKNGYAYTLLDNGFAVECYLYEEAYEDSYKTDADTIKLAFEALNPAAEAETTTEAAAAEICSLCELEKDCDVYTVDGVDYVVCSDCYNEFATAFGLLDTEEASVQVCSLCEEAKECGVYTADGVDYVVCSDCYNEFATAFGLLDTEEAFVQVCSLCEEAKECGVYTADGVDYVVCDDCYNEFATAFGLIE